LICRAGQSRPRQRINEDYVSGEFKVHPKRLSKARLAGLLLLVAPVFAGTILPYNGSGFSGLTAWNASDPCQAGIDQGGPPLCPGVGQAIPFLDGSSANGVEQFVTAASGGFFISTVLPGWGFTDPQNQDPPLPGTQISYFLPPAPPLDLGPPGDTMESVPEPSTLWLLGAGLIAAGWFGRKLAGPPAASRERAGIR